MQTIFDTILDARTGLGDVGVAIDPFTGATSRHLPVAVRFPGGPVVSREHFFASVCGRALRAGTAELPSALRALEDTFNCGVAHADGRYVMLVRFQDASRSNHVYLATSGDGIRWEHEPRLIELPDLPAEPVAEGIRASGYDIPPGTRWRKGVVYDPRVTQTPDEWYHVTLAVDYDTESAPGEPYINICDSVLYRTRDFERFEFVCTLSGHTRNCVLFPRQIDGWSCAVGRPNASKRANTVLFRSRDLSHWEAGETVFAGGHGWMIYAGPGFPPFETEDYWVLGVHGVETHGTFQIVYRAGVCLLDKQTLKVVAGPVPILHPEQPWERSGTVNNVIFPTGLLFSDGRACGVKSATVKLAIYYGAADSCVGVAMTTVGRLIEAALGEYQPVSKSPL